MQHKTKWIDAKKGKVISVEALDARNAVCSDHQRCVIAKAIKRVTNAHWVDVGLNTVKVRTAPTGPIVRYRLRRKAREQVRFFDTQGQFAPCYVELSVPSPSVSLDGKRIYSESYAKRRKYRLDPNRNKGKTWKRRLTPTR